MAAAITRNIMRIKKKKNIIKLKFWFHIGIRYLKAKNKKGKVNIIFVSLFFGITGGLMVLVVVLGIMNGFQENHISRRIEIGSYHVTISKKNNKPFTLSESLKLKNRLYDNFCELEAVIPYSDREVMIRVKKGDYNEEQILKLRALDPDEIIKDSRFLKYLNLAYCPKLIKATTLENDILKKLQKKDDKSFIQDVYLKESNNELYQLKKNLSISEENRLCDILLNIGFYLKDYFIILGEEICNRIYTKPGALIYITPDISLKSFKSEGTPFKISNVFNTGSYDYDRYWGFISIYSLIPLSRKADIENIGIKFKNKKSQKMVLKKLKKYLGENFILQTAEEINRGYFLALKLEKIMIILLFIMIFFMVATNTFGAISLNIIEKKKDISVLTAIGAHPEDIKIIFIIESLILGFAGSLSGVLLGTLIAYNIHNIFLFAEFIINSILSYITYALGNMSQGIYFAPVKIYDTSIYYQASFPVKINFYEIIIICMVIIGMTIFAAYIPVMRASKLKPNEVIKN